MRAFQLVIIIIILSLLIPGVPAQGVLDAQDLAVGDWDLKLRCGKRIYSTLLFPPLTPRNTIDNNEHDKTKRMISRMVQLPPLPFVQTKSFPCQLSLYPNGTFVLRPKDNIQEKAGAEERLLSLRGRWKVNPNPYCITDRFYDELHLQSYPRTLTESPIPPQARQQQPLQQRHRLSLQLHCRLCGRYASAGPWRVLRGETDKNARLTRGLLVWSSKTKQTTNNSNSIRKKSHASPKNTESQPKETVFQRIFRGAPSPLGASFQGKRMVPRHSSSPYQEQEDVNFFGY